MENSKDNVPMQSSRTSDKEASHRPEHLIVPITDLEAQRVFPASVGRLRSYLRTAHLLARAVVVSPSFLFESQKTEWFYRRHLELIHVGDVLVSMSEYAVDDFIDKKREEYGDSPELKGRYGGYFRPTGPLQLLRGVQAVERAGRMKETILANLTALVESAHPFSLCMELRGMVGNKADDILNVLRNAGPLSGQLPFTWEVLDRIISPSLCSLDEKCIRRVKRSLRLRLLSLYFQSLAALSGSAVQSFGDYGQPRFDVGWSASKSVSLDTFEATLGVLKVKDHIDRLTDLQLFELKNSAEAAGFTRWYFDVAVQCLDRKGALQKLMSQLEDERKYLGERVTDLLESGVRAEMGCLVRALRVGIDLPGVIVRVDGSVESVRAILERVPVHRFRDRVLSEFINEEEKAVETLRKQIFAARPRSVRRVLPDDLGGRKARNVRKPIVLVLATDSEWAAAAKVVRSCGFSLEAIPCRRLAAWSITGFVIHDLIIVRTEMGTQAAGAATLTTERAIREFCPSHVVMPGIAFGLKQASQQICDILVGQTVIDYETAKVVDGKVQSRGAIYPASTELVAKARQVGAGREDVHYGEVLCGCKVVNDDKFCESLIERFPNAIGGEMEGIGLASACHGSSVPWLLAKAICDWGTIKTDTHQQQAAEKSVHFCIDLVKLLPSEK